MVSLTARSPSRWRLAAAILVPAALLLPASAAGESWDPCDGDAVDLGGQAYAVVDLLDDDAFAVVRWYVESNGVPGLQRGGPAILGEPDPCTAATWPDVHVHSYCRLRPGFGVWGGPSVGPVGQDVDVEWHDVGTEGHDEVGFCVDVETRLMRAIFGCKE